MWWLWISKREIPYWLEVQNIRSAGVTLEYKCDGFIKYGASWILWVGLRISNVFCYLKKKSS